MSNGAPSPKGVEVKYNYDGTAKVHITDEKLTLVIHTDTGTDVTYRYDMHTGLPLSE